MRILAVFLMLLLVGQSYAADFGGKRKRDMNRQLGVQPQQLLQQSTSAKISNQRAAGLVKQRYSSARVLGVSKLSDSGPTIYRVRTLSPHGVVKSVFVDGDSGEVFE